MNILKHKGFDGTAELDLERGVCRGKILFIKDLVIYESDTISGILAAFRDAVDDYIETCAEIGKDPEKPMQGVFQIRISPELHKACVLRSLKDGIKLNETVERAVSAYIHSKSEVHNNFNFTFQKREGQVVTGMSSTSTPYPWWQRKQDVSAN